MRFFAVTPVRRLYKFRTTVKRMSSPYTLPNSTPVVQLDCKDAFAGLSVTEKLYGHYLSKAAWYGGLIVLMQTSPESPAIFLVLQKLFRTQPLKELEELARSPSCGFTEDEWKALLIYASGFYTNMGNYKGFGDTKFIPNLPQEKMEKLVLENKALMTEPHMEELWSYCCTAMYSLTEREKELGLEENGISTYFSANCTRKDTELAQKFMDAKGISPYNTRLFKVEGKEKTCYEVRLASSCTMVEGAQSGDGDVMEFLGDCEFNGELFSVTRGDYSKLMCYVTKYLQKAKQYAANKHEEAMLTNYVNSFTTGSLQAHKDGSRHWIKDKGPIVESYIGFIESYRDPVGVRGEFEGFVAIVNKKMSQKFQKLVELAETFLQRLPWGADYEKDKFLKPDFTSLDILTFAGSGVPAGINIPNYDDIRQNEGFKNVSLGNVLNAGYKEDIITFLNERDMELYKLFRIPAFELQVGLHELLGHGSGKLFQANKEGKLNFDANKITNLITGEKITSWYKPNETYDSKFTVMGSSFEECRAECVGMYLCLWDDILRIFGHEGEQAENVMYINWLLMVRAGLLSLEFYAPQTKQWKQAHMRARYAILQVLLAAGQDLVTISKRTGEDDQPDLLLTLDKDKIRTIGKAAIGDFLRKLQVYKSMGDVQSAKAMYDKYSEVSDDGSIPFLSYRNIVMERKQPRKMLVQPNTVVEGNDEGVSMLEYESSPEGLIQSFSERFPTADVEEAIFSLWEKDRSHFS